MPGELVSHFEHISESIRTGLIEASDALSVISGHFRFSQYSGDPSNEVQYRINQDDNLALTIVYDRGSVSEFKEGPALSTELARNIRREIDAEISFGGVDVSRAILFASVPTSNFWRYRDKFQILPVPPQAPLPNWFVADHPLILEVTHKGTLNPRIRVNRSQRELRQIGLLLGLVLRFNVQMPPRNSTSNWMFVNSESESGMTLHSEYLQQGYTIPDWTFNPHSLTDPTCAPCDVIVDTQYFSAPGISIDSVLNVPQCVSAFFDHYFNLSDSNSDRFLRSCYWYCTGNEIWNSSQSASFISLVQAIEALLPGDERESRCDSCGHPLGPGPTRKFSEFVEVFAAGTPKAMRSRLYNVRSQLAHGGSLLSRDEGSSAFATLHPNEVLEREEHSQLRKIARAALINWLLLDAL